MVEPLLFVSVSVRMPARSLLARAVLPLASFLIASPNSSVMLVVLSLVVVLSAGLNVGAAGPVVSTVKVALACTPWLPLPS